MNRSLKDTNKALYTQEIVVLFGGELNRHFPGEGASMTWKAEIITDTFNLANLEVKTPSAQPTAEQEQVSISC